jgi:hypothetical protein
VTISGGGALTNTFTTTLTANNGGGPVSVGNWWLSTTGYTANVTGTIEMQGTGTVIKGATVTIAGISTTTASDGTFAINGLPVDLGDQGGATCGQIAYDNSTTAISTDQLQFPLVQGSNPLGILYFTSPVSTTEPGQPYDITGAVTINGSAPASGTSIEILLNQNGNTVGSGGTDSTGAYYFWVVPGTYTITAVYNGNQINSQAFTLSSTGTPVTVPTIKFGASASQIRGRATLR